MNLPPAQRGGASTELLHFWRGEEQRALVWAACGAGKTEVTFPPLLERALNEGGPSFVCHSPPARYCTRDGRTAAQCVSCRNRGGSLRRAAPRLAPPGNLVVATTHQVLGFYRRFQLAVLDEVDAFPYQGSEMLRFGLHRALAEQGRLVEMTATPPSGRRNYARIITIPPARYHGHPPLPEPRLLAHPLPPIGISFRPNIYRLLLCSCCRPRRPGWFLPPHNQSLYQAEGSVGTSLKEAGGGFVIPKKSGRAAIIERFRRGQLDVLVTTSVLERGVNFPGVQVLILYADHNLYNVSTLVQIAGRVGRAADYPPWRSNLCRQQAQRGNEKKALRLIRTLNKEARAKGLLINEAGA